MSDPSSSGPARGGPQRIPRPAAFEVGPGAPWSGTGGLEVIDAGMLRLAFTAGRPATGYEPVTGASAPDPLPLELPGFSTRPAAVLCAVFDDRRGAGPDDSTQAHVVLTRRSDQLRSHTGEVSFPGGRLDPGEEPREAALREAQEEIGLDPATVEIIGELTPLSTVTSRAAITPFVGLLSGRPDLRVNAAEVERVVMAPLVELCGTGVYHEERWPVGGGWHRVHFFDLVGDTVWGATARMLRELLDRIWAVAGA